MFIPLAMFIILKVRWRKKADPDRKRPLWWRQNREIIRCVLNAPRAVVAVAAFFVGFGRVSEKLAYNGGCRNDGFSSLDSLYVLLGIVVNGIVIPILKAVFEATFVFRRDDGEISMSESEEWRRRLRYPCMDLFLTLSPLLGALLFPEGRQVAEKTERTCLRGWGCEVKGFAPVVGLGSILLGAYLLIVCGVVFWRAKQGSVTRARVQWSFIFLFPFWLAWYLVCVHVIAGKKTSTYKEAAFLVAVSLTRASDIRTYAVVPAVVWANVLLDILYYPVIVLMWRMTAVPDRSFGGGLGGMGRLLGTRNINPGVFHNPSSSLHAQRKHKGRAGGSPTGSGPGGSPTSPGGVHATLAHVGSSNALLGSRGPSGGASPTAWSAEEKYRVSPARSGARGGHAGSGVGPAVSGPQNFAASPGHVRSPKVKVHPAPTEV